MQYTLCNHLQYGWAPPNDGDGSRRIFITKIGECSRKPESALDESVRAAKKIVDEFGSDIVLCMSGGVDSECLARAFLEAKIPVRAAIARYLPDSLNEDDIVDAIDFCKRFEIPTRIFEIDLIRFFETEKKHLEYVRRFACRSPQLAVHMELLERIRDEMHGVPVLSGNPTEATFDSKTGQLFFLLPSEPHLSYLRYFAQQKIPGVPFFFCYSPELIYSFWQTPQFMNDLKMGFAATRHGAGPEGSNNEAYQYMSKVRKYQQGGFQVQPRDRKKTGFEQAKIFFRDRFIKKGEIQPDFPHEAFNYFFRRPLEELCPYPSPTGSAVAKSYLPPFDDYL
jgi:hypothetical protein